MVLPLPEPMPVGPHIRLFRWSLLIAGCIYGFNRNAKLRKFEMEHKEANMKRKAEREAIIMEQKRIASEKDVAMIASLFMPDEE